jgi:hypothetical protein
MGSCSREKRENSAIGFILNPATFADGISNPGCRFLLHGGDSPSFQLPSSGSNPALCRDTFSCQSTGSLTFQAALTNVLVALRNFDRQGARPRHIFGRRLCWRAPEWHPRLVHSSGRRQRRSHKYRAVAEWHFPDKRHFSHGMVEPRLQREAASSSGRDIRGTDEPDIVQVSSITVMRCSQGASVMTTSERM